MTIKMRKFGTVLNSRSAGREAFLAIRPALPRDQGSQDIILDFHGVEVLTPSFADEFITPLIELQCARLRFENTGNITVSKTLRFLARDWPEGTYKG
ncbi:MAG: Uncharacterized protein Greene041619_121 [Candidatus Peregrinibacteria bacterium Greene0416_19]|nr:MAG: Uncharacterized protein Greene041619_121 [Candidatus Peregrinibacteria bacterium Greene0416_19]